LPGLTLELLVAPHIWLELQMGASMPYPKLLSFNGHTNKCFHRYVDKDSEYIT
jgi:hypothetical protein